MRIDLHPFFRLGFQQTIQIGHAVVDHEGELLGSKYFDGRAKMLHAVTPLLSGSSDSRHENETPEPSGERVMPRCFSYHWWSFSGSSDLKKIPPVPGTRFMAKFAFVQN